MATDTPQLASQTQSLESGPEFYNCGSCPHNCVGGSEAGCPTPAAVPPPKPSSWYCSDTAQLAGTQTATPTQSLDGGAEFYNCWSCSHNCVGGSEQGCIPSKPEASVIVHDPSKMGQLAMPVAAATTTTDAVKTVRPGVGHVYNLGPAMILGALAATAEAGGRLLAPKAGDGCAAQPADGLEDWLACFRASTDAAAGAVTPLGQHILRRPVFAADAA